MENDELLNELLNKNKESLMEKKESYEVDDDKRYNKILELLKKSNPLMHKKILNLE